MASFPSSIVSLTNPSGTSLLSSGPDHGTLHTTENQEIIGIETFLGTNSATNVFGAYTAGQTPLAINSGGTPGSALSGGTFNKPVIGTPSMTGGIIQGTVANNAQVNGGTYGTPTIGTITVPGTVNALSISAAIAPGVGSVADSAGGTMIVNAQQGNIFYSVMGTSAGNRTIGTPLNTTGYQLLTFAFQASGSANGTLVWSSIFHISQDAGTPTLGTGTSWNYYSWRYNQISGRYEYQGNINNIT